MRFSGLKNLRKSLPMEPDRSVKQNVLVPVKIIGQIIVIVPVKGIFMTLIYAI
jgi:hypothetical protein